MSYEKGMWKGNGRKRGKEGKGERALRERKGKGLKRSSGLDDAEI